MNLNDQNPSLFLVVLGGRKKTTHIELHDVRWVIGNTIEDTFPTLRNEWFGDVYGLHIDSYKKIEYIDGYRIEIFKTNKDNQSDLNYYQFDRKTKVDKYLWFINLGAYDSKVLNEIHQFGLIVAETAKEAKSIARNKWLKSYEKLHKDDMSKIETLNSIDDCHAINYFSGYKILLTVDPKARSQALNPDWFGYKRIDIL